ncbi:MAG: hypothetical protein OEW58_10470 [Gammaproteobacteria bacterium]|nr:hypothetical protein [Gammaproteobacteria bacterium]
MNLIRSGRLFSLLLAISLVLAQCLLLSHQTELEQHFKGDPCEYCLHASGLANVHVANTAGEFALTTADFLVAAVVSLTPPAQSYISPQPRAPPVLL